MNVHLDLTGFSANKPVVTIGMFDGVHSGHRSVLEYVRTRAEALGGQSTVLTFWPHPRICFEGSATKLRYLTTLEEKSQLIAGCGIDHLVLKAFTPSFAQLSPEEYIKSVLVDGMRAHTVIVGYDHNFGYRGAGNYDLLAQLGDKYGFSVEQLPALSANGTNISSTKIRESILSGNIELATEFLGHPYLLTGTVADGKKLGRTIGFPTANISIGDKMKLVPSSGVYAIEGSIKGQLYEGVMNIGTRPTIDSHGEQTLEAYFFNFADDIYGETVSVRLHKKLRDEIKFASIVDLKAQIVRDVASASQYFATR
jgi:riboflavin kinase / FMN adenylyltransferase